ncbi:MAG: tRNA (N6-isopentenyl adenosine(37)-C2)-methylthiotransferase MiaB [Candidatus Neomarinimicrobiota bacterium]
MNGKKYYIETYGCQMNEADSELVAGLLQQAHYQPTTVPEDASVILVNSCSVRENADRRAIARLSQFKNLKMNRPDLVLGILGCVAQRDRGKILAERKYIDLVLGPDAYRDLPEILEQCRTPYFDVNLSRTEVYDDLIPFRKSAVNAWVSIMRGCNKFCTFCIVPYLRGRERSRPPDSIVAEIRQALKDGYREVTLLGQNVNSYHFSEYRFPELLRSVASIENLRRIRFTSPHPRDVDEEMLAVMQANPNLCKQIHLPLQAGSSRVLQMMNRSYDQAHYLKVVEMIRKYLPQAAITTDIIVGFPDESATDFEDTLAVMRSVRFDAAFMFKYSPRSGTKAAAMPDNVPEDEKARRLKEVIQLQKNHTLERNKAMIGTVQEILIDGVSKKNPAEMIGRTDTNKIVVLKEGHASIGEFCTVRIEKAIGVSLFGKII